MDFNDPFTIFELYNSSVTMNVQKPKHEREMDQLRLEILDLKKEVETLRDFEAMALETA